MAKRVIIQKTPRFVVRTEAKYKVFLYINIIHMIFLENLVAKIRLHAGDNTLTVMSSLPMSTAFFPGRQKNEHRSCAPIFAGEMPSSRRSPS